MSRSLWLHDLASCISSLCCTHSRHNSMSAGQVPQLERVKMRPTYHTYDRFTAMSNHPRPAGPTVCLGCHPPLPLLPPPLQIGAGPTASPLPAHYPQNLHQKGRRHHSPALIPSPWGVLLGCQGSAMWKGLHGGQKQEERMWSAALIVMDRGAKAVTTRSASDLLPLWLPRWSRSV